MNTSLLRAFVLACLPVSLTAQSTWVVDPSGGGDFTSLQSAQTAASPGDTLILQGSLPGVTLSKRLHLIADGSNVFTNLDITAPGSLSIHGGTFAYVRVAGSVVSLSGVTTNLLVESASAVVARDCTLQRSGFLNVGAWVEAGAQALFDGCSFRGQDAYAVFGVQASTSAMRVEGHAQLRDCTLQGGLEFPSTATWLPLHGSPAIDLTGSVDLRSCVLTSGGANIPLIWGAGTVRSENTNLQGTTPLPATVTVVPATLPWLTGDDALPGGSMQVFVDGPPSTLATISASLDMRAPVPSWLGDIWLEPAYLPLSFGITDGAGSFGISLPMPLQVHRGTHVTFQGLIVTSGGGLVAMTPAVLQVR